MATYEITSNAGVEMGRFEAESAASALDAMARDAGYESHAAACEVTGSAPSDWTESRAAFRGGTIGLLVVEVAEDDAEDEEDPGSVTVMDYDSGDSLEGTASAELVERSREEGSGTGAVPAYRDSEGVWQYVQPSDVEHYRRNLREDVITVYVE